MNGEVRHKSKLPETVPSSVTSAFRLVLSMPYSARIRRTTEGMITSEGTGDVLNDKVMRPGRSS